jgi:hypothetical protein
MSKNKILLTVAVLLSTLALSVPTAYAWSYSFSGSGKCQPDGTFLITWIVDNSKNKQELNVYGTTSDAAVPQGADIPAHKSKTYTETVAGTVASTTKVVITGDWQADPHGHNETASVTLAKACAQPTPVTPPASTPVPPVPPVPVVPPAPTPTQPTPVPETPGLLPPNK